MKIKLSLSRVFRFICLLDTFFMLGYLYVFDGLDIKNHLGQVQFVITAIGIFMAIIVLLKQNNKKLKRLSACANNVLGLYTVAIIIAGLHTWFLYDYSIIDFVYVMIPYLYIYIAYPMIYIFYNEDNCEYFLRTTGVLVIGIIFFKSIAWYFYNFRGVEIFPDLLFQYGEWIRDGVQRIDSGYLFGFMFSIYVGKALKRNEKQRYKVIAILMILFMLFVTRFRFQLVVMIVTALIIYYYIGIEYGNHSIRFLILTSLFLAFVIFGLADSFVESFSVTSNRSGSTIARLLTVQHYWNLMIEKGSFLGLGFLDSSLSKIAGQMAVRDSWRLYYLSDIGIVGGVVQLGLLSLFVYGSLFFYAIKTCIKAIHSKSKYIPLVVGISAYMVLSCFALNIFDSQRAYDTPFYLAIISFVNGKIAQSEIDCKV